MKVTWLAVLSFAVTGCTQAPPQPSALEKEARASLDLSLNDAASARIRDVELATSGLDGKTVIICGLVNAKNQMGAYAGWKRFFLHRNQNVGLISPDASEESERSEKAAQAVFESAYPAEVCPATHYRPPADVQGAVAAMARDRRRR